MRAIYKKSPCTLVSGEISVSIQSSGNTVTTIQYNTVTKILVNVPKNDKFILKIVTTDGDYSLQFSTLTLREEFKQCLQSKINLGVDNRQQVLANNHDLRQLHADLVIKGVLTEDEFWSNRQQLLENYTSVKQVSIPKPTDHVTLTPEIIHSIFTLYPAVLKAYQDLVPTQLQEKEFWSRYFSSKYLNDKSTLMEEYFRQDFSFEREEEFRPDMTMRPGSSTSVLPLVRKYNATSQMALVASNKRQKYQDKVVVEKPLVIKDSLSYQPLSKAPQQAEKQQPTLARDFSLEKMQLKDCLGPPVKLNLKSRTEQKDPVIDNKQQLQHLFRCALELLRHYWAANADRRAKIADSLVQMRVKLSKVTGYNPKLTEYMLGV